MGELKKEYIILFNGITDAIGEMQKLVVRMQALQLKAEEALLEREADVMDKLQPIPQDNAPAAEGSQAEN